MYVCSFGEFIDIQLTSYQVTFALVVIQLRSSWSLSIKRISSPQKIRASQFSLPASTLATDDVRRLGDRYSQSTAVSLAIVTVELLSCLQLHSASPFVGTILPVYSAALFSSKVLRWARPHHFRSRISILKIQIYVLIFPPFCSDAAERNRLDATTFRLLNFGIILDAVQTVSSTLPITVAIARSSSYLRSFFGLLCLYHAYLTASTSYSALTNYGIPVIKFGVAGPLSAAYLVTFLDKQAEL